MSVSNIAKVLIIDLDLSNIGSIYSAIQRADPNAWIEVCAQPGLVQHHPTHIILPGVGTFYEGSSRLKERLWSQYLTTILNSPNSSTYFLGICLGMQLLASNGSEGSHSNFSPGLNFIPSNVCSLHHNILNYQGTSTHIGWNTFSSIAHDCALLTNVPSFADFYYLHSYAFDLSSASPYVVATSAFSDSIFPSIVSFNNIFGVQFHPEKSQAFGHALFKNFLQLC